MRARRSERDRFSCVLSPFFKSNVRRDREGVNESCAWSDRYYYVCCCSFAGSSPVLSFLLSLLRHSSDCMHRECERNSWEEVKKKWEERESRRKEGRIWADGWKSLATNEYDREERTERWNFKKILCTLLNFGRRNRGLGRISRANVSKILYTTQTKIENKKLRERALSPPMNERTMKIIMRTNIHIYGRLEQDKKQQCKRTMARPHFEWDCMLSREGRACSSLFV